MIKEKWISRKFLTGGWSGIMILWKKTGWINGKVIYGS